jgi:ribosomal protein S18 acetylase RimI-like enzyme
MNSFTIRDLEKEDCKEAALIRFEESGIGFLPVLGLSFYSELLEGTCSSKWGFGKVCVNANKRVVGFVFAATDIRRFFLDIFFRKGLFLFISSIRCVLAKPKLLEGIIRHLFYPNFTPVKRIKAEWLTMSVSEIYRNRGIGKALTSALTKEFKSRNIFQYKSTVASKNKISCLMHERLGFKLIGSFYSGREMILVYKYDLNTV